MQQRGNSFNPTQSRSEASAGKIYYRNRFFDLLYDYFFEIYAEEDFISGLLGLEENGVYAARLFNDELRISGKPPRSAAELKKFLEDPALLKAFEQRACQIPPFYSLATAQACRKLADDCFEPIHNSKPWQRFLRIISNRFNPTEIEQFERVIAGRFAVKLLWSIVKNKNLSPNAVKIIGIFTNTMETAENCYTQERKKSLEKMHHQLNIQSFLDRIETAAANPASLDVFLNNFKEMLNSLHEESDVKSSDETTPNYRYYDSFIALSADGRNELTLFLHRCLEAIEQKHNALQSKASRHALRQFANIVLDYMFDHYCQNNRLEEYLTCLAWLRSYSANDHDESRNKFKAMYAFQVLLFGSMYNLCGYAKQFADTSPPFLAHLKHLPSLQQIHNRAELIERIGKIYPKVKALFEHNIYTRPMQALDLNTSSGAPIVGSDRALFSLMVQIKDESENGRRLTRSLSHQDLRSESAARQNTSSTLDASAPASPASLSTGGLFSPASTQTSAADMTEDFGPNDPRKGKGKRN